MAQGLNSLGHTASSSSSDSSEDEEEARRISAAICDESLFKPPQCQGESSTTSRNENLMLNSKAEQSQPLKSNRPQDRNNVDDDNVLQTTQEFRTYIAKQLSQVLDRDLSNSVGDQVWSVPCLGKQNKESGIYLFSDSKNRFRLSNVQNGSTLLPPQSKPVPSSRPRKRRLSTSSESSEDEKINSIVFSVDNIQEENNRLAGLEKKIVDDEQMDNDNKKITFSSKNGQANFAKSDCKSSEVNEQIENKKKTKSKKKKTKEKSVI